ncbi:hypothetical protein [Pseudomonas sp.]|uniref:hypothetical protein n=1 Tax=Pseudomonas sp. TaxID=306 RepID=UPI003CC584BA
MKPHRIPSLAEEQARIDAARANFTKEVTVLESFEFKPLPERRAWIDPETILKRKPMRITRDQRRILKQMADSL